MKSKISIKNSAVGTTKQNFRQVGIFTFLYIICIIPGFLQFSEFGQLSVFRFPYLVVDWTMGTGMKLLVLVMLLVI